MATSAPPAPLPPPTRPPEPIPPPVEVLSPTPLPVVVRLAAVALALGLLAVVVGLVAGENGPGLSGTLRLALVAASALLAGGMLSLRPDSALVWLLAALAAAANSFGFPDHWDSGQMLMRVAAVAGLVGAGLMAVPRVYRRVAVAGIVAFHFSSLLVATTWPDSTPWITNQLGQRVYLPFMQFTYLRNAYHFYSPEPGPASHLFALLTYETDELDPATGKPKTISEWVTLPRRDSQWKDPLGQTYYRRLSLTENAVRSSNDIGFASDERSQVKKRRDDVAFSVRPGVKVIPYPSPTYEVEFRWYAPPQADVSRFLLPSFTKHLAAEYTSPGFKVVNVKLYRAEHRIVTTQFFVTQKLSPFHPTLYRVYFLGDYSAEGQLADAQDPMLYWLIPILPKSGKLKLDEPSPDQFTDYLTEHAGFEFPWSQLRP